MIVSHEHPVYMEWWEHANSNRYNGAYYYSVEIVENIIPNVKTSRSWVTVNLPHEAEDGSIVFIHSNRCVEQYDWLRAYKDLVLVCGVPGTCGKVSHLGTPVYLPLSIDVPYVEGFKREKDADACFVGRASKRFDGEFPIGTPMIYGKPREELLTELARYRKAYAVGRCAIEAHVLGCDILPYDPRFPDPSVWGIIDNSEAAGLLQGILEGIDS